MAIKLVQFQDKANINANPDLPEINKVIDSNMNELKDVANTNANNIGDLENLNTADKSSLVNAINELTKPPILVRNKSVYLNCQSVGNVGNFSVDQIDGYTLCSAQAQGVPSADVNAVNFNLSANTVYWVCTRAGYANSGNSTVRLIYVRNDLIE